MRIFLISLVLLGCISVQIPFAKAESEAACAIWLCLPGGFPTGCAAAYSEFKHRLKKGKSPLPSLSSCTTGPNGNSSNGNYQMGVEYFFQCKEGFQYNKTPQGYSDDIMCIPTNSQCNVREKYRRGEKIDCTVYQAKRREQTHYIKMWVDGKYLGQFFYQ
jgi:hypothetical protein